MVILLALGCGKPATFLEVEALDGIPLADGTETLFQDENKDKVDILFVDDNSASMMDEQAELGKKFPNLMGELAQVDWRIAVTTTDISPKGVRGDLIPFQVSASSTKPFLERSMGDVSSLFSKVISRPESEDCWLDPKKCPSKIEKPLRAAIMSIEKDVAKPTRFFRDNSDMAIVVITDSDEDNLSKDPGFENIVTVPSDLVTKVSKSFIKKRLSVYGISIRPKDTVCLAKQAAQEASEVSYSTLISQLVDMTGGLNTDICATDYSQALKEIGRRVRETLTSLEMKRTPVARTVEITITPIQNVAWSVAGNRLLFSKPLTKGTRVDVKYRYKTNQD